MVICLSFVKFVHFHMNSMLSESSITSRHKEAAFLVSGHKVTREMGTTTNNITPNYNSLDSV